MCDILRLLAVDVGVDGGKAFATESPTAIIQGDNSSESDMSTCTTEAVPDWKDQITLRGFVLGTILGGLFAIIIVRMNVGYGIQPPVNIASGLMGYFFLKVGHG